MELKTIRVHALRKHNTDEVFVSESGKIITLVKFGTGLFRDTTTTRLVNYDFDTKLYVVEEKTEAAIQLVKAEIIKNKAEKALLRLHIKNHTAYLKLINVFKRNCVDSLKTSTKDIKKYGYGLRLYNILCNKVEIPLPRIKDIVYDETTKKLTLKAKDGGYETFSITKILTIITNTHGLALGATVIQEMSNYYAKDLEDAVSGKFSKFSFEMLWGAEAIEKAYIEGVGGSSSAYDSQKNWSCRTKDYTQIKTEAVKFGDKIGIVRIYLGKEYYGRAIIVKTDTGFISSGSAFPASRRDLRDAHRKWANDVGIIVPTSDRKHINTWKRNAKFVTTSPVTTKIAKVSAYYLEGYTAQVNNSIQPNFVY